MGGRPAGVGSIPVVPAQPTVQPRTGATAARRCRRASGRPRGSATAGRHGDRRKRPRTCATESSTCKSPTNLPTLHRRIRTPEATHQSKRPVLAPLQSSRATCNWRDRMLCHTQPPPAWTTVQTGWAPSPPLPHVSSRSSGPCRDPLVKTSRRLKPRDGWNDAATCLPSWRVAKVEPRGSGHRLGTNDSHALTRSASRNLALLPARYLST